MSRTKLLCVAFPVALLCGASALHSQVLVNDLLNDTNRSTQDLPDQVAWFKGGGSHVVLTPTTSGMIFGRDDAGTSRLLTANFVNDPAGRTLSVGETLIMDYTFSASAVGNGALNTDNRLGLFSFANSPNARPAADNGSANGPSLVNVSGYVVYFQISSELGASPFTINKVAANATDMSKSASFSALSGATTLVSGAGHGLISNTSYTLRLELSLVEASKMDITVSYLDSDNNILAAVMVSDETGINDTFDSFMYRAAAEATFGGTQTISNFKVSVIPEPSTYAALVGASVLGLAFWRRRRAS